MSLTGNLGFVSLDEVLRLLHRSKQRGAVVVRGGDARGHIFVDRGSVSLATMFSDDQLRHHLGKSGLAEGEDTSAVTELLREMTVETIYQLGLHGESFEVVEDQASPYPNPAPFDLEELLVEARQRLSDWADVNSVVTDLDAMIRMRRDLGERDRVTIEKDAWRLLSEVGHGATVRKLAEELGTTEFWTARVTAGLIGDELLALEASLPAAEPEWSEPAATWTEAEQASVPATDWADVAGRPPAAAEEAPIAAEEAHPAPSEDHPESVFQPGEGAPAYVSAEAPEADASHDVDPNQSWWSEPEPTGSDTGDGSAEEVEEDTEAFLEKVFSDLDPSEPSDEGYGLLRRRRMGALRDLSNDA